MVPKVVFMRLKYEYKPLLVESSRTDAFQYRNAWVLPNVSIRSSTKFHARESQEATEMWYGILSALALGTD